MNKVKCNILEMCVAYSPLPVFSLKEQISEGGKTTARCYLWARHRYVLDSVPKPPSF